MSSTILEELQLVKQASQDQTAASAALVQEVAAKMGDVDSALSAATSGRKGAQKIYVNGLGSDDGLGTVSSPFKTVIKALETVLSGTMVEIVLSVGVHVVDGDVWPAPNSMIFIVNDVGGNASNTELFFEERISTDHSYVSTMWTRGGHVCVNGVKVRTGMRSDSNVALCPYAGIQVMYGGGATVTSCEVEVGDFNLFSNANGWSPRADFASFQLSYLSSVTKVGAGSLLSFEGIVSIYGASISLGDTTWADLVSGNNLNAINNIGLS